MSTHPVKRTRPKGPALLLSFDDSLHLKGFLQKMPASSSDTCKESGCDDEVYEDGYCKYHYYINAGSDILRDIIN